MTEMEFNLFKEVWKDVIGYESSYMISNYGRVYSKLRIGLNRKNRIYGGKLLKLTLDSHGYDRVSLCTNNIKKMVFVHRMVCDAFLKNTDKLLEVNHIDGNKINNHISNLEKVSSSENTKHAYSIGLMSRKGESHNNSKLTSEQVTHIRNSTSHLCNSELGAIFGVSYATIYDIKARRTWKHIN